MCRASCASFARAVIWLVAVLFSYFTARSHALDPGAVSLKVTNVQRLADGRAQVTLQWNALGGATYRVQGQQGLSQAGWLDFGLVTPAGVSGQWTGTVASALVDQGRFFMRLVLPQEKITSLEPAFVASGGGVFYILGQCFAPTDRVFVNGVEATVVVFEDHTRLKVTVPAMAAGAYDVEVRASDGTTDHAKLTDSLGVMATGRSDEAPPVLPRTISVKTISGEVVQCRLPLDIRSGDHITGTVPETAAVRPATGEIVFTSVDLTVPGRGLDFLWARTYRSKNGPSTAQGEGWDFSYNLSATQSGGDVVVRDGEGRADTFFNQGDGTWSRTEFFRQGTMSGTVFTLTFADRTAWRFRAFDAATASGKIDRVTDRNGNHLDFAYDGTGRLTTVTDTLGRNFGVTYDGAGRIASVTDFSGRAVTYGYNAAGDLTSVTSPPVTGTPTANDFPTGKTTTFAYSSGFADARLNHNLLTVTDALGQPVLQNTYAATLVPADLGFDRCTQQVRGGALAETVTFTYLPQTPSPANRFATTLTIINDLGDVSEVRSDSRNRPLEVRACTGRSPPGVFVTDVANRPGGQLRAGDPVFFLTAFEWNPNSCLSRLTLPRGGVIGNVYESDLNDAVNPREAGNLRVEVREAAPSVVSDFPWVSEMLTHLPGFGTGEGGYHCPPLGAEPPSRPMTLEELNECATNDGGCYQPPFFTSDASLAALPPGARGPGSRGPRCSGAGQPKPQSCDAAGLEEGAGLSARSYGGGGASSNGCTAFVAGHTDGRGFTTGYGYDVNGNLTAITPPIAGTAHTFEYNASGQLSAHIWPQNASGSARRDEFHYYAAGPQTGWLQNAVIDSTGFALTTTWEYNGVGALVRRVDPRGRDTLITVNALNQPVRVTSREAGAGVRYETDLRYDADDRITSIDTQNKDETGALVAANPYFTTQCEYDACGRLVRVTREVDAANTATTERVIDANNHKITLRSPEAVAGTQPLNVVTHIFDERGLPFQIVFAPTSADQSTTQYDYDADCNVSAVHQGAESTPRTSLITWDGLPPGGFDFALPGHFDGNAENTRARAAAPPGLPFTCSGAADLGTFRVYGRRTVVQPPLVRLLEDLTGNLENSPRSAPPLSFACSSSSDAAAFKIVRDGAPARVTGLEIPLLTGVPLQCMVRCVDVDEDGYGDGTAGAKSIQDPMGNKTTLTRDASGNVTGVRVDGEHNDAPGDAGNVRMAETRQTCDALNRPATRTGLLLDNAGAQTGSVSASIAYAPNSQPASMTDPRGNVTTFGYDTANRLALVTDAKTNTRALAYDANGNMLTVTATDKSDLGNPNQVFVVTRTFDGLDRALTSADNAGNTTQYSYDSRSNPVLVTDARNIQTRRVFDGLRRLLSVARDMDNDGADAADPQDIVISRTWDRNSRLATTTNANGYVTTHSYDALNRPGGTLEADGTTSGAVVYDVHDNVVQTTDANGTVVVRQFDLLDRLISTNIAPGAGVAPTTVGEFFTHDGLSRLKSAVTSGTAPTSTSRTYDSLSRVLTETQGAYTVARVVDDVGNYSETAYSAGNVVSTTFDALNRPLVVTDSVSGVIVSYAYIGPGRVERQTFGNGTQTNFQYDGIQGVANAPGDLGWRQIRSIITSGPGGTLDSRQFFRNANQEKTKRVNLLTNTSHIYTPDNAARLVDTLVQQGVSTLRHTVYSRDKEGSRLNVSGDLHPGVYQMNPALPVPGDAQMNQYTAAPGSAFVYDENGSRTSQTSAGTTLQYVYDYAGRLVNVVNATTSQPVAACVYDAFGRRVQKTTYPGGSPQVTNFLFDDGTAIEERDGGGSVTATVFAARRATDEDGSSDSDTVTIAVKRAGVLRMLHTDDMGSTMVVTHASGGAAERYEYHDCGEPEFYTGAGAPLTGTAIGNTFLFAGLTYEREIALYFCPVAHVLASYRGPPFFPWPKPRPKDRWIEIGTHPAGTGAGGGGSGKASISDIVITKPADKSSTDLMKEMAKGKPPGPGRGTFFDPKTGSPLVRKGDGNDGADDRGLGRLKPEDLMISR